MDKVNALNEVKALIDKGAIRFSDYDMIENVVTKEDTRPASIEASKKILYDMVDNHMLSAEVYETLKPYLKITATMQTATPSVHAAPAKDPDAEKSLHGFGIGFVFGFFLNLLGLILGLVLGDSKCKKGTLTGFLISIGISILAIVIYFVVIVGIISANGGM